MNLTRTAGQERPRNTEILSLLFALLVVLLISGLSYRTWIDFRRDSERLATTRQIVTSTNALLSSLKDAETGQRGFLLTGDDRYLDPYRQALTDVPANLKVLTDTTATGAPDQVKRIEALGPLIADKLDELKQTIDLRQSEGLDAAVGVVRTARGKALMDQIRQVSSEILATALDGLAQYTGTTRSSANQLGLVGTIGSTCLLALLIFSTVAIQRGTRRRQRLIQELQESEAKAREARDWLQTTMGSIGDGVIATDAGGNVTFLNGVSESLTGWTQEEAAGRPLNEIFVIGNEETEAIIESPVSKVLREGRVAGLANHTRLRSRDGRNIPIDDSAAPIRDAQGNIVGVVLVFRDITERRQAERIEKQATAALARQADLLARTNSDLEQFAYSASHDLQEPLRMITTYSQLLIRGYRGQLDGQAGLCVEYIADGARRMRELLADLLSYVEVAGDGQESTEAVDLNTVYENTIQNLKAAIEETGAVVTRDSLPTVPGHEAHYIQLLQNLVGNSIKYRSGAAPRIHIAAEKVDDGWRLAVTDNGIGISPEYHKRIFGVFKRLHGKNIPGTGIGLAICQRVVERNGGRIWVESEEDRGATFYFTVPQDNDSAAESG
jgi:PAS domain S-box-containing protein